MAPPAEPQGAGARRVLAVKLSSFGDIVHATPSLRALRLAYPGAQLVMAVERRWRDVVAADPHLDGLVEVASYPHLSLACLADLRRALRALGSAPFDVAVDLQGTRRSAACVYLSGARVRYGRGGFRPGWRGVMRPARARHAVEVCADACRAGGVPVDDLAPRLYTSPGDEPAVDAFLDASGVPRDGFVLVNPYSRNASKDLPDATVLALLEGIARIPDVTVLVTSGADERDRADALVRAVSAPRVASIAGRLPLAQALCVFRRARLMVSCDSGPLHAAAALGTPVVAVFGPTLPECTGPWGQGHVIVQALRPPTPFAYRDDRSGRYMAANTPESIVRAVRGAVQRPAGARTQPA